MTGRTVVFGTGMFLRQTSHTPFFMAAAIPSFSQTWNSIKCLGAFLCCIWVQNQLKYGRTEQLSFFQRLFSERHSKQHLLLYILRHGPIYRAETRTPKLCLQCDHFTCWNLNSELVVCQILHSQSLLHFDSCLLSLITNKKNRALLNIFVSQTACSLF